MCTARWLWGRRATLLLIAWAACPLGLLASAAASAGAAAISVKDYGARGDGVTDDTQAILAAMKAASIFLSQPSPHGVYYQAGPVLVFPAGEYLVSDEIPIGALEVCGEGRAVLRQKQPDKSILTSRYAWRLAVRGLTFIGGKNQLDLYNPNMDTGQILIERCRFYGASGFGVRSDVLSTTVKIEDCEFLLCRQAWYNGRSDQAVMRDCWITSSQQMEDQAVIEHRGGRLTIENLCGVPLTGGPRQRWVDNYGANVSLVRCRFGGEGGGFTPVYNFARYANQLAGPTIVFEDCFISANASYNANCALYCLEVPNSIRISHCQMGGCAGVLVDKKLDLSRYFRNATRSLFSFTVEGCTGEVMGTLPPGLAKPVIRRDRPQRRILTAAETARALAAARKECAARPLEPAGPPLSAGGHTQKTRPGEFVELSDWSTVGYMDATVQPNAQWLAVGKAGDDVLFLFRQTSEGGWPHVTLRATLDLDRTPWLCWRQKPGTAPGSFALKVIDRDAGVMRTLYTETFAGLYDYHAHNLKQLFGGGKRAIEVRYHPLGWGQKTAQDFFWAQPGQYVVMDFMRAEAE